MVSSKGRMWIGFRSRIPGIALLLMVALVGLASAAAAFASNTYYVSKSAGSDANAGTSKSAPWAHIPGMASCTGSTHCGAYSPAPGDTFILMGCDVWTNSDLPVLWNWSGSSGSPITITVDKTWYNTTNCPSSWNRPVFDAQKAALSSNFMFRMASGGNTSYVVLDNIEMKGMYCAGSCPVVQHFIDNYNTASNWTVSNNYFHGWNFVTDNCIILDFGDSGDVITQNVIDGSDATGASPPGATCYASYPGIAPVFSNNVIHDVANGIVGHSSNPSTVVSGNLIYNIKESNAGSHPNAIEFLDTSTYYVHDNVIHDSLGEQLLTGGPAYVWNNVIYNILGNPPDFDARTSSPSGGWWNNTIVSGTGCFILTAGSYTPSVTLENNHCISPSGLGVSGTGFTLITNLTQTPAQATMAPNKYVSSGTYAYAPGGANWATVGVGTNSTSSCSGQMAGLCSDTGYAVSYNASTQTVTVPARTRNVRSNTNVGAYEYGNSVNPPTGLTATVH